ARSQKYMLIGLRWFVTRNPGNGCGGLSPFSCFFRPDFCFSAPFASSAPRVSPKGDDVFVFDGNMLRWLSAFFPVVFVALPLLIAIGAASLFPPGPAALPLRENPP